MLNTHEWCFLFSPFPLPPSFHAEAATIPRSIFQHLCLAPLVYLTAGRCLFKNAWLTIIPLLKIPQSLFIILQVTGQNHNILSSPLQIRVWAPRATLASLCPALPSLAVVYTRGQQTFPKQCHTVNILVSMSHMVWRSEKAFPQTHKGVCSNATLLWTLQFTFPAMFMCQKIVFSSI